MLKVYCFLIICTLFLAVISRKHFSKYKDRGVVKGLFFSMGKTLYGLCGRYFQTDKVKERIRNNEVVMGERLNAKVEEYLVGLFSTGLMILIAFTCLSAVAFFMTTDHEKAENIAVRQDYGGDEESKELILSNGEEKRLYELKISQRVYTREEFYFRTEEIFSLLGEEILGENKDLAHVKSDLTLFEYDKDSVFYINWRSDKPEFISPFGVVKQGEKDTMVHLVAEIEYMGYKAEHLYNVVVEAAKPMDDGFTEAIAVLEGIEAASRDSKSFALPDLIGDVEVLLPEEESNTYIMVLILGIIMAFLFTLKKMSDLKEKNKKRDDELRNRYSDLVNHIWLFLGTGMTVKSTLSLFVKSKDEDMILVKEILLCLKLIDAGENEAQAYEDLGRRLGVSEYNRLFSHISQNLRMGTKDIRNIIEDELILAETTRRELIKKRGEEASSKLIFPMVIMLAIVMVIVMVPALVGFV